MKEPTAALLTAMPTIPGIGTYVWRADRDTVEWSASLCAVYGVETPPTNERKFLALVHPDDRLRVEAETVSFLERGSSYEHQFRIVRPDGVVRHILDKATIERDAMGRMRVVHGINVDVTDQADRNVETQALREDEERLRLAGAAAGIGFWDVHLGTGRLDWSDEMYDLLGRPRGGASSVDLFFEHVLEVDRDRTRSAFERAVADRTLFSEEFRIRRADGAVRHLVGRGRVMREDGTVPTRAIGVNYDVTERREAEAALRAQAERLRALMDGVMALVGLLDAEGRLLEINQPTLELGGYRREDLLGRPLWETEWHTHDPESAARYRDAILAAAAGEATGGEVSVRMADGSLRDVQFLAAPFADGGPARVVLSGFDVTDRKRSEAHVRDLMREMSHRAKNAYTLVLAIARQVQRHSPDDFFPRFSDRLAALSASHDLVLKAAGPEGAPLRGLVEMQLRPIDEGARRIEMAGPDVTLSPDAAQALGMALHELGTNATKHGALSVPNGRVVLTWVVSNDRFRLEWRERGGPPPHPPERQGFGTIVLGTLTERTLNVTCESDWAAEGLCWTLQGVADQLLAD